ncbi:MAG: hypothetical protein QW567_00950 [Candidatus Hadarchaeales archaeon]
MTIKEFDLGWITAFVEIKGVFSVNKIVIKKITKKGEKTYLYNNPVFYADSKDEFPVEMARSILGVGKVIKRGNLHRLEIRKKEELIQLANLLSRGVGGRKSEKFEKWKELVLQWKSRAWRRREDF